MESLTNWSFELEAVAEEAEALQKEKTAAPLDFDFEFDLSFLDSRVSASHKGVLVKFLGDLQ